MQTPNLTTSNLKIIDDQNITTLNDQELLAMDDQKLFAMCQKYGEQARIWRQKFAGLLPEVNKRRLYERKGFESIFVFAKKLASMSELQVRRALNLKEKFKEMPMLQNLLINGEVSMNKLARVASIATPKNQEILAEQAKILSNRALETFVKDERTAKENSDQNDPTKLIESETQNGSIKNKNSFQKPLFDLKSVHVHTQTTDLFEDVKLLEKLSSELKTKLKELDQKGLDINQILLKLLQNREEEIAAEKEKIGEAIVAEQLMQQQAKSQKQALNAQNQAANTQILAEIPTKKPSRYLNVKIKNVLKKEFGDKCSIPGCNNLAKPNHHTQRFGLSQNNDPRFLAPLCPQHHEIAHSIDQKYQFRKHLAICAT
jgi:hypothetical protein